MSLRAEATAKERLDEAWPLSLDLALGERVQPQNADAAGERVRETGHEQDVGGARQDEPAGGPAQSMAALSDVKSSGTR